MHTRPSLLAALSRPLTLVVLTLTVLALIAGSAAYALTGKTVSLAVDGEVTEVSFRGGTVGDALQAADLTVGDHDALVPSADTAVEDGDQVALRRGRPIELVVDGEQRTVWVTALDVDEALQQLDLREEGLYLSASRSRSIPLGGLSLQVRTPQQLTIGVDGVEVPVSSAALTVGEVLEEAAVVPGRLDRVTPAPSEPVTAGMRIAVDRVSSTMESSEVAVPFGTERRDDATLTKGTTKELTAGVAGSVRRTVEVVVVNGGVESRAVVAEEQVSAPVTRVLAVGTKAAPAAAPAPTQSQSSPGPRPSQGGADSLNWPALARCESGGNPRAVSSTGKYRGLYQFSQQTWNGVGGSGDPAAAPADEQTFRAKVLYNRSGAGQWPSCGKNLFS